eukprot:TRINITY_DN45891_c0_g1_i1.p1 TRINITY_DN45891_c0_g1~~TRINITY_DN45891_c0_g1_i1.p1  ORF type:complete len:234 (+),score=33.85 TRINITY_DN45891_c0_g1_i1:286-987(+)
MAGKKRHGNPGSSDGDASLDLREMPARRAIVHAPLGRRLAPESPTPKYHPALHDRIATPPPRSPVLRSVSRNPESPTTKKVTAWREQLGACTVGQEMKALLPHFVQVSDLFRGKSRLKMDMLMKEFVMHAGSPAAPHEVPWVDVSGFRSFLRTKGVRNQCVADQLFRAADTDADGQVSFVEFRKLIGMLRGPLEERIGGYLLILGGREGVRKSEVWMLLEICLLYTSPSPRDS